ncbi:MAG: hypothetical protein WA952_20870 [Lewinella sp.]
MTIAGQDIPNLHKGSYRDFEARIVSSSMVLQDNLAKHNRSTLRFEFANGSIMEFVSYGDKQDAKNGKRDIAFFNEGNGIPYAIYRQVAGKAARRHGRGGVVTYLSGMKHKHVFVSGLHRSGTTLLQRIIGSSR